MTESELKIKLQELGFVSRDGVEWSQYIPGTGRIAARFSYQIYKTKEVRINLNHQVEIYEDNGESENSTYERAFQYVSETFIQHILIS